jgi:hypothetical protein
MPAPGGALRPEIRAKGRVASARRGGPARRAGFGRHGDRGSSILRRLRNDVLRRKERDRRFGLVPRLTRSALAMARNRRPRFVPVARTRPVRSLRLHMRRPWASRKAARLCFLRWFSCGLRRIKSPNSGDRTPCYSQKTNNRDLPKSPKNQILRNSKTQCAPEPCESWTLVFLDADWSTARSLHHISTRLAQSVFCEVFGVLKPPSTRFCSKCRNRRNSLKTITGDNSTRF